jgi:hypothetical protein
MEPVIGDEIMYEIKRLHADMRQSYRDKGIDQPLNGTAVTARLPWSGYYYFDPPSPGTIATYHRSTGMALEPPEKEWLPEAVLIGRRELRALAELAAAQGVKSHCDDREIAPYIKPEAKTPEKEIRPAAPPGVHFTPEVRIGDEVKNKYLNHLGEMMSRGFIDQQEYDARLAVMMTAKVKEELERLVQDLPGMTVREPLPSAPVDRSPGYLLHLSLVSMAGSLALCTAGLVFAGLTLMGGFMWGLLFFSIVISLYCIVKR